MAMAFPVIFSSLVSSTHKNPLSISVLTPKYITSLLKSCSNIKEILPIHSHSITTNLIRNCEIGTHVFHSLISFNEFDFARQVLTYAFEQETVIWNTLLENQLKEGNSQDVSVTYYHMVNQGVLLDLSTFHFLIHACSRSFDVQQGREVHGRILKSGFGANKSLNNNLMGMYSKCRKVKEVRRLFEKLHHKDVISWNTIISCYNSVGMYREASHLFDEMLANGVKPDEITMISLLSACAKLRDTEESKKFHVYIEDNDIKISGSLLNCLVDVYVKCGKMEEAYRLLDRCHESEVDVVLQTTLISGYVKAKRMDEARCLFDKMTDRNLISWTTMMSGYVHCGRYSDSLKLFNEMRFENVNPDEVALVTALSACVHAEYYEFGKAIHGFILRYGMIADGFLGNALLDLYAKCENLTEADIIFEQLPHKSVVAWNSMLDVLCRSGDVKARSFFDNMPDKDIVSWNIMVNYYVKHNLFRESFELFQDMQMSNVKPDKITLIGLLSSCARSGALNHGIWIHVYIQKNDIEFDTMLATALIDMYGNCGCTGVAYELFSELTERNVFVWTAMISAYAMQGQAQKAIELYLKMEEMGIKPDSVTFIAVLSACSHGGLVDEGYEYFNKMQTFYSINPKIQHYGCMVDLLGRTGRLEEAVKFIEAMTVKPDVSIWSCLMRASGNHQNVELAELAFKQLIEIDPVNDGAYMLLANLYANAGRWDEMSRVRMKLHDMGIRKQAGLSLIEQDGVVHEFTAGGFSNPQSAQVHSMLEEMEKRSLKQQELPDSSSRHSEKLAVAFGLINSHENSTIRVVNTVRMCGDCHSFMKETSQAYNREIAVRDGYKYHLFKDGCCTCKDFW